MRGWFRLRDNEHADTIALLCAADAFPPTAFNAGLPMAWTPPSNSPCTSAPGLNRAGCGARSPPTSSPAVS